ncbi:hypothetical protein VP1G_10666 [Cytospora mali]|uniref:Uncharacterized protein n=1 Tax=Cytospora mali TaxID=578113 RepID=A0A194US93_CYTMA|nr:hypothetical protein VP1G_10666 [Valsa mali var. pyri (nom. inval.)]
MLGTSSTSSTAHTAFPDIPTDTYTDYDNCYPDWISVSYELQREDALDKVKTEFSGMPDDANTKAWDDLITPTFFSAYKQDLKKIGESVNDSVPLADG